jgi:hypothetical protein
VEVEVEALALLAFVEFLKYQILRKMNPLFAKKYFKP